MKCIQSFSLLASIINCASISKNETCPATVLDLTKLVCGGQYGVSECCTTGFTVANQFGCPSPANLTDASARDFVASLCESVPCREPDCMHPKDSPNYPVGGMICSAKQEFAHCGPPLSPPPKCPLKPDECQGSSHTDCCGAFTIANQFGCMPEEEVTGSFRARRYLASVCESSPCIDCLKRGNNTNSPAVGGKICTAKKEFSLCE